jgi:chemotaxis protein CheD
MQAAALTGVPGGGTGGTGAVEHPTLFLHAGQILVTAGPQRIATIVGSCVSVCLWEPRRRHGGINHFLLPSPPAPCHSSSLRPLSYGELAMPELIQRLCELGGRPGDLQAKVFGGSEAFGGRGPGSRNVIVALDLLAQWGIPLSALDVAGSRGRKLIFDTSDGSVLVRRL